MRVDRASTVRGVRHHRKGKPTFRNKEAGSRADNAAAQHPATGLVEQQLGKTFIAAERQSATACSPRKLRFLLLNAVAFCVGLGESDPCDLRIGVGNRWNRPGVKCAFLAGSHFGGHFGFV